MGNALGMFARGLLAGTGEAMEKINTRRYEQEAKAAEFMKELSLYELKRGINAKYEKQKAADQETTKLKEKDDLGTPYQGEDGKWYQKVYNKNNEEIGIRETVDPNAFDREKLEIEKEKVNALNTQNTLKVGDKNRKEQADIFNNAQSRVQSISSDIDNLTKELSKTINEKTGLKEGPDVAALEARLAEKKLEYDVAYKYMMDNKTDIQIAMEKATADALAKEKEKLSKQKQEELDKEVTSVATTIKMPEQTIEEAKATVNAIRLAKPVEKNINALAVAYAKGDPQTRAEMEVLKKYHEDYYMKVIARAEELRQENLSSANSGYLKHTSETDKRIPYKSPILGRYNSMFQGE